MYPTQLQSLMALETNVKLIYIKLMSTLYTFSIDILFQLILLYYF